MTFGSPCQDLSVAGKRAGLDGDRSSMFFQAIRIIKEMRNATNGIFPQIAIWENVPGALSTNKGADFGVVLDALADIGAVAIEWAVLDAQHFGVPQRRRRVFVVAVFDPATANRCPDPLLPVSEGRRRDSAKGKPKGKDVAETVGSGSGSRGSSSDTKMPFPIQGTIIGRSDTAGPQGTGVGEPNGVMYTLDRVSQHGVVQPYSFDTQFGSNANVFTDLSPTLKATQSSPSVATEYAVRRLTPLECERLMGWPDDHTRWTDDGREQADSHRYRQCGNGVATPVAAWIGRQILSLLDQPS
ncbi:MAG: DNA (cytosine-5-)-methyltransferase [Rhodobacteraceae bacterium]|nr:DNA (cytosine-5-)-methyltransferase [Paracoccaceae bacterium]